MKELYKRWQGSVQCLCWPRAKQCGHESEFGGLQATM